MDKKDFIIIEKKEWFVEHKGHEIDRGEFSFYCQDWEEIFIYGEPG